MVGNLSAIGPKPSSLEPRQLKLGTPFPSHGSLSVGPLSLGTRIPDGTQVGIQAPNLEPGRYSLYRFVVTPLDPPVITACRSAFNGTQVSPFLLELCAGFGRMGHGAEFLGGAAKWTTMIYTLDAAMRVHQHTAGKSPTAAFGFPCQPYSSQARQMGTMDPRAKTLWGGLRIVFLTQWQAAIIERVAPAGRHPAVQTALRSLAQAMGWVLLQSHMELAHQRRRHRWWAIMMPAAWQSYGFTTWPSHSLYITVGTIFGKFTSWDTDAMNELRLDEKKSPSTAMASMGEIRDVWISMIKPQPSSTPTPTPPWHARAVAAFRPSQKAIFARRAEDSTSGRHWRPSKVPASSRSRPILLGVMDTMEYTHGCACWGSLPHRSRWCRYTVLCCRTAQSPSTRSLCSTVPTSAGNGEDGRRLPYSSVTSMDDAIVIVDKVGRKDAVRPQGFKDEATRVDIALQFLVVMVDREGDRSAQSLSFCRSGCAISDILLQLEVVVEENWSRLS